MTPRQLVGWARLIEQEQRAEDLRRFAVIRAAMHADKEEAQKFMDELLCD